MRIREVIEGPQEQGAGESVFWTVDISGYGASPDAYPVTVLDQDGEDVTATTATGSSSLTDTTHLKTPLIHGLTAGQQYRVVMPLTYVTEVKVGFFVLIVTE